MELFFADRIDGGFCFLRRRLTAFVLIFRTEYIHHDDEKRNGDDDKNDRDNY